MVCGAVCSIGATGAKDVPGVCQVPPGAKDEPDGCQEPSGVFGVF